MQRTSCNQSIRFCILHTCFLLADICYDFYPDVLLCRRFLITEAFCDAHPGVTHSHTYTLTRLHTHTLTHSQPYSHTHTHRHTHAYKLTQAHTHRHTHTLLRPCGSAYVFLPVLLFCLVCLAG